MVITSRPAVGSAGYILRREAARRICSLPVLAWANDYIFQDTRLHLRVLEMSPFCIRQDEAIESDMPRSLPISSFVPASERPIGRLAASLKRKAMIASIFGARTLARLELQRITRQFNRRG